MRRGGAVLVTGAARRIGRAIVERLARDGFAVAVHASARSFGEAESLVSEIVAQGGRAMAIAADLADAAETGSLVARATEAIGPLSHLVNNASIFEPDEVGSITPESWGAHQDINLRAPILLAQAFARLLPATAHGNIINIVDQRVWKLNPTFFSYTTSKAGLWTATRTLAQALAPRIRVNAIGPGPTLQGARQTADHFARQRAATILERGANPQDIAAALGYFLDAPAVTGQILCIDGGQHLGWKTPDVLGVE